MCKVQKVNGVRSLPDTRLRETYAYLNKARNFFRDFRGFVQIREHPR